MTITQCYRFLRNNLNKYPTNIRESIRHAQKVEVPPQKKKKNPKNSKEKERNREREGKKTLLNSSPVKIRHADSVATGPPSLPHRAPASPWIKKNMGRRGGWGRGAGGSYAIDYYFFLFLSFLIFCFLCMAARVLRINWE